jgi:hypothetical protein
VKPRVSRQAPIKRIGIHSEHDVDFHRSYLKQVVSIHQTMFAKLLFEEDSAVGPELAELFQDIGRTYLQISKRINENCSSYRSLQD